MTAKAWAVEALKDSPRRVLEIGCGDGELARALAAAGHDVVAIDPGAPDGAVFRRTRLEEFEDTASFDAVVASLSLHHIADLNAAVDKVAGMLVPEGAFVVNEFAWERLDGRAANWAAERLGDVDAPTVEAQWDQEHRDLHTGGAVLVALERRFDRLRIEWFPTSRGCCGTQTPRRARREQSLREGSIRWGSGGSVGSSRRRATLAA